MTDTSSQTVSHRPATEWIWELQLSLRFHFSCYVFKDLWKSKIITKFGKSLPFFNFNQSKNPLTKYLNMILNNNLKLKTASKNVDEVLAICSRIRNNLFLAHNDVNNLVSMLSPFFYYIVQKHASRCSEPFQGSSFYKLAS